MRPQQAFALGIAAIRETYEETGVVIGRPGAECRDQEPTGQARIPFPRQVAAQCWRLQLSSLHRWSHWITPAIRKTRYDTRFFLCWFPPGQSCVPDGRETTAGRWATPAVGLKDHLGGNRPLSPPALVTLHELLAFECRESLLRELATRPWGPPRQPRVVPAEHGAFLLLPWDPDYAEPGKVDPGARHRPLRLWEPFSRLWHDGRMWRPAAA